jgi:hypothetical protein
MANEERLVPSQAQVQSQTRLTKTAEIMQAKGKSMFVVRELNRKQCTLYSFQFQIHAK